MDFSSILANIFVISLMICVAISPILIFLIYRYVKQARFKREAAYSLQANAVVIAKRSQIEVGHNISYTFNFATFEIEGIGRIEFNVGDMYGLLIEGDRGVLRYLTNPLRFVDFSRAPQFQQIRQ